jgi:hypothetical protein
MITPTYFTFVYFYHYRTGRCFSLSFPQRFLAKINCHVIFPLTLPLFILITSIRSPILCELCCAAIHCVLLSRDIKVYTHSAHCIVPKQQQQTTTTTTTIKMKLLVLPDDGERKGNLIVLIMHRNFFLLIFPSLCDIKLRFYSAENGINFSFCSLLTFVARSDGEGATFEINFE